MEVVSWGNDPVFHPVIQACWRGRMWWPRFTQEGAQQPQGSWNGEKAAGQEEQRSFWATSSLAVFLLPGMGTKWEGDWHTGTTFSTSSPMGIFHQPKCLSYFCPAEEKCAVPSQTLPPLLYLLPAECSGCSCGLPGEWVNRIISSAPLHNCWAGMSHQEQAGNLSNVCLAAVLVQHQGEHRYLCARTPAGHTTGKKTHLSYFMGISCMGSPWRHFHWFWEYLLVCVYMYWPSMMVNISHSSVI